MVRDALLALQLLPDNASAGWIFLQTFFIQVQVSFVQEISPFHRSLLIESIVPPKCLLIECTGSPKILLLLLYNFVLSAVLKKFFYSPWLSC